MAPAGLKRRSGKNTDVGKKQHKHRIIIQALKKNRHPKLKRFFVANYIPSRVFRGFDLFSPACATFLAELCNPITRQAIELESCSNLLRIQQVL